MAKKKEQSTTPMVSLEALKRLLQMNGYEVDESLSAYSCLSKNDKLNHLLRMGVEISERLVGIEAIVTAKAKPIEMTLNFPQGFSESEPCSCDTEDPTEENEPVNYDDTDSRFWESDDVKEALSNLDYENDENYMRSVLRNKVRDDVGIENMSVSLMGFAVYGEPMHYRRFTAKKKAEGIQSYLFCCNGEIFIRQLTSTALLRDQSITFAQYVKDHFKDITGFDIDTRLIHSKTVTKYANIDCYDVKCMSGNLYEDWNDDALISEGKLDGDPDTYEDESEIVEEETVEEPIETDESDAE